MDEELRKKAGAAGQTYVREWCEIHAQCPEAAVISAVGAYATIWAIMGPAERTETLHALLQIAIDVGDSHFEDGNDFLSYLKEKREIV